MDCPRYDRICPHYDLICSRYSQLCHEGVWHWLLCLFWEISRPAAGVHVVYEVHRAVVQAACVDPGQIPRLNLVWKMFLLMLVFPFINRVPPPALRVKNQTNCPVVDFESSKEDSWYTEYNAKKTSTLCKKKIQKSNKKNTKIMTV